MHVSSSCPSLTHDFTKFKKFELKVNSFSRKRVLFHQNKVKDLLRFFFQMHNFNQGYLLNASLTIDTLMWFSFSFPTLCITVFFFFF